MNTNLMAAGIESSSPRLLIKEYDLNPSSRAAILQFPSGSLTFFGGSTMNVAFVGSALGSGGTNYIQNTTTLQSGATFFVSSGTVNNLSVAGTFSIQGSSAVDISGSTQTKDGGFNVVGRLGIGDTSPAASLTVGSGDLFQVDSSGRVFAPAGALGVGTLAYSFVGDTDSGIYSGGANILRLATAGVDRIHFAADGSIGINNNAPGDFFEVIKSQNASSRVVVQNLTLGSEAAAGFLAYTDVGVNTYFLALNTSYVPPVNDQVAGSTLISGSGSGGISFSATNASGALRFYSGGRTERMRIGTSGNIGIGTIGASSLLDVSGGSITVGGLNGGISASTYTINGRNIFVSSFSVRALESFVIYAGSESINANTTVRISPDGVTSIAFPMVCELEDVNTAGTSIRVKTIQTDSFDVYNSDIVNNKRFLWWVFGKR